MSNTRGFSLIEVLVACGVLVTGVLALAALLARSVPINIAAGHISRATVLAAQKVEELRVGAADPVADAVEYLDRRGAVVGAGGDAPRGAIYARRWTAVPLSGSTAGTYVLTVVVEPLTGTRADRVTTIGVRAVP